jgi:hypothetical protein
MKIVVEFHNQPKIEIAVDNTETGRLFFELTRQQNTKQAAWYRDTMLYTPEYMIELAHQARAAFGWDWVRDHYNIAATAQLHKDLENSVGQLGFENIPEQYDKLLYDLHHCLHAVQFGKNQPGRLDNFQIEWLREARPFEWLRDDSVALPASFEFKETSRFGDLILINPYVGHNPLQIYLENDFSSLATTCRFHDCITPGIVITVSSTVTKDQIVAEFIKQAPEFVELHGADKIRYYAGSAVVGHVINLDQFAQLKQHTAPLILKSVEFYD